MLLKSVLRTLRWAIIDAFVIFVAYVLAYSARSLTAAVDLQDLLTFVLIAIAVNIAGLYLTGVYQRL